MLDSKRRLDLIMTPWRTGLVGDLQVTVGLCRKQLSREGCFYKPSLAHCSRCFLVQHVIISYHLLAPPEPELKGSHDAGLCTSNLEAFFLSQYTSQIFGSNVNNSLIQNSTSNSSLYQDIWSSTTLYTLYDKSKV